MGAAIGQALPIAVGVLISPMPIVAMVLMLVSRSGRSAGVAFLLGWLVGVYGVGTIVLLVAGASTADTADPPQWVGWVKIVLGLGLLLVAWHTWRGRPRDAGSAPAPTWMKAIDSFGPLKALGLGVLLGSVNPKNLLLIASGAAAIATATASTGSQLVALGVFTAVASVGVAAPLVIYLAMGHRAADVLGRLQVWMVANNATIMTVLLLVLGAKMIGDGVSG